MGARTRWQLVDGAAVALLPLRGKRGSTWFGRLGDVAQQPATLGGVGAAIALAGGRRGRRAVTRGSLCYGAAAVLANAVVKPLAGRSRPPGAGLGRSGPVTSSFPSGHAATDLAFALGLTQEIPWLFAPLTLLTLSAHWSLVRSRGHYPTDILVGGAIGVAVAVAAWRLWPSGEEPAGPDRDGAGAGAGAGTG